MIRKRDLESPKRKSTLLKNQEKFNDQNEHRGFCFDDT